MKSRGCFAVRVMRPSFPLNIPFFKTLLLISLKSLSSEPMLIGGASATAGMIFTGREASHNLWALPGSTYFETLALMA